MPVSTSLNFPLYKDDVDQMLDDLWKHGVVTIQVYEGSRSMYGCATVRLDAAYDYNNSWVARGRTLREAVFELTRTIKDCLWIQCCYVETTKTK